MLRHITTHLPRLRRFDMARCFLTFKERRAKGEATATVDTWSGLLAGCPLLEELNVSSIPNFRYGEGPQVVSMLIGHPTMKRFIISGIFTDTDSDLHALMEQARALGVDLEV
jgi:hypothetical protein